MSKTHLPEFPLELTEKKDIEQIIPALGFLTDGGSYARRFDGLGFSICESIGCHVLIRDGRVDRRTAYPPRELRVFPPASPIEMMATIYKMWAEVFDRATPQDSVLVMGKRWLDYQRELKQLIPPPPTLRADRAFLRHCLNHIDQYCDWSEEDYEIRLSSIPGQLRLAARDVELFCPASGEWIGEISVSARELFRGLPKRFQGPAVLLQIEAGKLRIDNRILHACWGEQHEAKPGTPTK